MHNRHRVSGKGAVAALFLLLISIAAHILNKSSFSLSFPRLTQLFLAYPHKSCLETRETYIDCIVLSSQLATKPARLLPEELVTIFHSSKYIFFEKPCRFFFYRHCLSSQLRAFRSCFLISGILRCISLSPILPAQSTTTAKTANKNFNQAAFALFSWDELRVVNLSSHIRQKGKFSKGLSTLVE